MMADEERQALINRIALLETRIKHLSNDLELTREEYEASMDRYFQIYSTLEQQVAERTAELARTNQDLRNQIIERRRAELQLQQSQKLKAIGTLAGGIAHDFNNILAAILGYTEMAMMDVDTESPVHRRLGNVIKGCERARDLVQQILTFSRQNEAEMRPLAPLPILKEIAKLLRSGLPSTIAIESRLPSQLPMILADPTHLHQVVMNLCTNAHQAMVETGGRLILYADVVSLEDREESMNAELLPGNYLKMTVADTGVGMAPEILERVFDPYFTTLPKGDGAGLGLSVVHGIVHRHGGSIHIESAPGQGTTVTVLLPVVETEKPEPAPAGPIPEGRAHILFVDDEQSLALIGSQLLERLGYTVTTRTSSVEALEAFQADPEKFDLLITDQTMPNLTGVQLARQVLELRPDLPVILCTGFSETVGPEQAMSVGIRDLLFKPIALRDLAEAIRRIFATSAA